MAKKQQKEKSIEETLWESANKLRGSVEPSEYKHVVLSLIFLKYAYDRFVERRNELIADHKEAFVDHPVFYNAKNVFYLNEISRWDYLMENAKQNDIAIKIDAALAQVEKDNPTLKGALPSNYYSGLGLDRTKLASLLDVIGKIDTQKDKEHDLIGRVYEYIEFKNRDEGIDFDTKMTQLQSEMQELLRKEEESKKELLNLFKELGYGLE